MNKNWCTKKRGVFSTGVLVTLAGALLWTVAPPDARVKPAAASWSWELPPDMVTPVSGKRNHVFYVGQPVVFRLDGVATRYEVRDYWGNVVDKGLVGPVSGENITLRVRQPGWYKLYLYGDATKRERQPWHDVVGGTMFVIFRHNPNFPQLPPPDTPGSSFVDMDQIMRGVTGMGPQRHPVLPDASKPNEAIASLETNIALDKKYYLPFDPLRRRALMIAFRNGTEDVNGVRRIIDHFRHDVKYWEPRNEPNFGKSGADFSLTEMKPFYEAVKSVDPTSKVMGPGVVTIGPALLPWIEDFLKAGGAKYIDVFSFHSYNNVNGDLWLARKSLNTLNALLAKYSADKLEKWQTEQGYFAAAYGAYLPRLQGRWTMLQMMVYEQYGIPKEHNHLWYDRSHGFWDFPAWWENEDGSLNPAAALMRVWSEELYGTRFVKAYNFGEPGNKIFVGSLFTGLGQPGKPARQVAAFMGASASQAKDGQPDRITLRVKSGKTLRVVSAFGVMKTLPVQSGRVLLPVPELPVYVELAANQTVEVVPTTWGPNLARLSGVTAVAPGSRFHPLDRNIRNDTGKLINGALENWYWTQQKNDHPWISNVQEFPAWVEVRLPKPATVSRVVVYATPPWQGQGSLLDYELQYNVGGRWVTLERVREPTQTFEVYTPPVRTTIDSFYSDRWIFQHQFRPVRTQRIRLLVHDVTWGGGATRQVREAQRPWAAEFIAHQINLREIEIYGR